MVTRKILFAYLSLFILGFVDNSRGPIYPLIIDIFSLTSSTSSYVFSLASLVSFIICVLANFWLPRLGLIGSTRCSLIFHSFALILMGTSSFYSEGFFVFLIACIFLGLAVGIQSITVNLIVAKDSPAKDRRKLFSGLHAMYGAAALLAPLVLSRIIVFEFDWRVAFIIFGIALLIFALAYKLPEEIKFDRPFKLALNKLNLSSIRLGFLVAFYVSTEIIVATRLVLFLKREAALSVATASIYLTLFFILLLAGRLTFAFVKIPLDSKNLLRGSLFFSILIFLGSLFIDPRLLVLSGLSMSYFFPCILDFITDNYFDSDEIISIVMNFVGLFLVFSHMVFGVITHLYGVRIAMYFALFLCVTDLYILQSELRSLKKK